jgi:hypothetical protein
MQTLSNGFLKPQNGDTGDVFWPALAQDIQQLNDHTHDGSDSNLIDHITQTLLAANWVAGSGGMYSQTVVMPSGFLFDERTISFRLSTGEPVYATVTRLSATSYSVTVNDNTITLVAYYG